LSSIPIGKPIANTRVYVLDTRCELVPIGVPGELYIAGDGLARGYLNRPELTAKHFVPNPFSTEDGACLYKTGDLVRYLSDGNLEFLGRVDEQVKIHGYRIELGEIQYLLNQHPAVRESVVLAIPDSTGDKRLAAFVTPSGREPLETDALRAHLKRSLPDYMVPAAFAVLDRLPLSPNGKVDRRALPAPGPDGRDQHHTYVAPRTPIEEQLSVIWCELFHLERISIHDNFFELGGHSLLAVRLFDRIRKTFNTNLPLATLFQAPTLEKLSALIRDAGWAPSTDCLIPIRSQGSRPPLFLVHAGGRAPLCYYRLTLHMGHDQPIYALKASSATGLSPLSNVEDLAIYFLREIRTVQAQGPYHIAGFCFGGTVAFEMARRLVAGGQKVNLLALLECYSPDYRRSWRMTIAAVKQHVNNLRRHGWREKQTYVIDRLRLLKGYIRSWLLLHQSARYSEFDDSTWNELAYAAAFTAYHRYRPQEYPGRVVLFKAEDHTEGFYVDPAGSWLRYIKGGLSVRTIPGVHNTILEEPHVRTLAHELRAALDEVLPRESAADAG
jgi:aspartate racemase